MSDLALKILYSLSFTRPLLCLSLLLVGPPVDLHLKLFHLSETWGQMTSPYILTTASTHRPALWVFECLLWRLGVWPRLCPAAPGSRRTTAASSSALSLPPDVSPGASSARNFYHLPHAARCCQPDNYIPQNSHRSTSAALTWRVDGLSFGEVSFFSHHLHVYVQGLFLLFKPADFLVQSLLVFLHIKNVMRYHFFACF